MHCALTPCILDASTFTVAGVVSLRLPRKPSIQPPDSQIDSRKDWHPLVKEGRFMYSVPSYSSSFPSPRGK